MVVTMVEISSLIGLYLEPTIQKLYFDNVCSIMTRMTQNSKTKEQLQLVQNLQNTVLMGIMKERGLGPLVPHFVAFISEVVK